MKQKAHFHCQGVDVNPKVAKLATKLSGCKVTTGEFLNMKFPRSSFDVICMFDTIEHLKEPKKYIKKISSLLKKGGIVAIETGDIDAILPRIQKDRWRLITPPYHLAYFSKKTLTRMFEAQQYKTKAINYVPFYRTLGQTLYRLNRKISLKPPISDLALPVNVYDLIFGIWQKTDIN